MESSATLSQVIFRIANAHWAHINFMVAIPEAGRKEVIFGIRTSVVTEPRCKPLPALVVGLAFKGVLTVGM